jgi:hypothetical protein
MAVPGIEHRVAALEADVARLKEQLAKAVPAQGDWLDEIYGAFENDPIYEEAMRLGREYRESLRPKPRGKQSKRARPTKAKKR